MRNKHVLRLAFLLFLSAVLILLFLFREDFSPPQITHWFNGFGVLAPIAFILAFTLSAVFFFPSPLLALAGGILFGPVWGAGINLAGSASGAALAFVIARYLASDWARRRTHGVLSTVIQAVEEEGWRSVALMRLAPFLPYSLVNYAFGLTRISFGVYLATTIICKAPGMFAYAWLGHAGGGAMNGEGASVRYALIGLGVLAMIAFLPHLIRRIRKKAV